MMRRTPDEKTLSVTITAPPADVVSYVSDVRNLPQWATDFCRELRFDGGRAIVLTPEGEAQVEIVAHPQTGVVDIIVDWRARGRVVFPGRVVPFENQSVYLFTWLKPAEVPWHDFDRDWHILQGELHNLKRCVETRASTSPPCPRDC